MANAHLFGKGGQRVRRKLPEPVLDFGRGHLDRPHLAAPDLVGQQLISKILAKLGLYLHRGLSIGFLQLGYTAELCRKLLEPRLELLINRLVGHHDRRIALGMDHEHLLVDHLLERRSPQIGGIRQVLLTHDPHHDRVHFGAQDDLITHDGRNLVDDILLGPSRSRKQHRKENKRRQDAKGESAHSLGETWIRLLF